MPRVTLTRINAPGAYAYTGQAITWTAADPVNKEQVTLTGKELVLARNVNATTAATVTITSVADEYGRTKDIAAHSIPANGFAVFGPFALAGWRQTDGRLYLEGSSADIQFAVIALP